MHHIRSDEQGYEGLVEVVQDVQDFFGAGVPVIGIGNHADLADRGKGSLGRGKIRASQKQQRYKDRISRNSGNTSGVHQDESPPSSENSSMIISQPWHTATEIQQSVKFFHNFAELVFTDMGNHGIFFLPIIAIQSTGGTHADLRRIQTDDTAGSEELSAPGICGLRAAGT